MKDAKLRSQVEATVKAVVSNPSVPGNSETVIPVTNAVMAQVTPQIDKLAGIGPWYTDMKVQGIIIAGISRLAAHFGYAIPQEMHGFILDGIIAFGPYVGLGMVSVDIYLRKMLRK